MTQVKKRWPLLTATHRDEKAVSTWQRGHGQMIEAPLLAYLIDTANGRILCDVGCDHTKIAAPTASARHCGALARETGAVIWPNHDMAFYRALPVLPVLPEGAS